MLLSITSDQRICRPRSGRKTDRRYLHQWRWDKRATMVVGDDSSAAPGAGSGRLERRLGAILGADLMGYRALMGRREAGADRRGGEGVERVRRETAQARGRVVGFTGDG